MVEWSSCIMLIEAKPVSDCIQQSMQHSDSDDDDIFESVVSDSQSEAAVTNSAKMAQAVRMSMQARGVDAEPKEEVTTLEMMLINESIRQASMTYQQLGREKYGLQGILLKESPSMFGGWDQRYCVLKGKRFIYKEQKSPISANAGILNFNLLSCQLQLQEDDGQISKFTISIDNAEKKFVFKGTDSRRTKQWANELQEAIQNSKGWKKDFNYLGRYHRFWRKDYQSEEEFRNVAQTGDILLFRGTQNSSVMQRALTRDQYDHVAVVLLNAIGDILLFEANGGFGVGICPWKQFMGKQWFNNYEIVVHRRLSLRRNQKFGQEVERFVASNIGKQYKFSIRQYIFSRDSYAQTEREHYFCSSLVAKLYKTLGLLQKERSCTQYLPSWFSDKDSKLDSTGQFGQAYLEPQKIIVFETASR